MSVRAWGKPGPERGGSAESGREARSLRSRGAEDRRLAAAGVPEEGPSGLTRGGACAFRIAAGDGGGADRGAGGAPGRGLSPGIPPRRGFPGLRAGPARCRAAPGLAYLA